MTTESECAFSSAKKLISPERNELSDTTIEVSEYLKAWPDHAGLESCDEKSGCTVYCLV